MAHSVRAARIVVGLALSVALVPPVGAGWAQAPAPQFPPGADYAGVAGSAAENARITALCGPNRNAKDGYAPTPAFPGQTRAPILKGTQGYAVEHVAAIDRPFGMTFLPGGKMLISFRNGGMRIVDAKSGAVSDLLENVPATPNARIGSGLFDVTADRNFARNRTIYFSFYTKAPGDAAAMGRIDSARLSADDKRLADVKVLREGADITPRRITQARDGTLFIQSVGDLADVGASPQDLASQAGKVLRINTDGSIPKDNPFLKDPKANPAVYALGFRDIHAATLNPQTGELWTAENRPMGGDVLNVIRPGKNYGMAVIGYGRQNNGAMINGGKTAQAGMEQPLYYWTPSIAPSGMTFYSGNAFKGWRGDIFIGAMSGQQLVRLKMQGERVVGEEKLLLDRCQRIKVVSQGPDGNLYVLTDEMPPKQNEILRLVPAAAPPPQRVAAASPPKPTAAAAPPVAPTQTSALQAPGLGAATFDKACVTCHGLKGQGGMGPPIAGRTDADFIAGVVRQGVGGMPALAGALTPAEIDAVAHYVGQLPH